MATISWQQKRETFNPEKNYFNIDYVEVSRETSEEEDRLSKLSMRYFNWGLTLCVIFTCGALLGGIALGTLNLWIAFIIVVPLCIAGILFSSCYLMNKSTDYENEVDRYLKEHDVWTTPEVEAIKQYNKEQNEIAEKWRAAHPFEEKIRACLLDPKSSVDVANLARFYALEYLKENNNG